MKVVVTGGTGFLGRHVVWRLAAEGHDVVFTGRNAKAALDVVQASGAGVQFVPTEHGDPATQRALEACAEGAEAFVHCAALSSPWGRAREFERANVDSTREVVAACRHAGVARFVHISTPSIYFNFADRLDIREDDPLPRPVNDYARTKLAAERVVREAGIPHTVILRPRALFGPWDNTILPRLLRAMNGRSVPLLRDGRALVDLTCVDNAVDAVMLALAVPAASSPRVYNISNGDPLTVRSLFEQVAHAFGLQLRLRPVRYAVADSIAWFVERVAPFAAGWEPPFTRYSLGAIAFSQTLDLTRARADLGYVPRVAFGDGLAATAKWWRAHHGAPS